jgi:polyhydroxybutyrate depolymerase
VLLTIFPDRITRRNEPFPVRRGGRLRVGHKAVRLARWFILALAPALVLALLGPPGQAHAASGRITLESGGIARNAILVQNRRLKQARRPLVIVLRSSREKGPHLKRVFGLEEMEGSGGPGLVYPEPVGGHWSDAPGPEAARDAAFIRDLIGKLVSDGLVDRRKVFIIGISNGGFTALRTVCDNAALFAGAAALITALPADLADSCKLARPVPFMMIAGTADPYVPYAGGKVNLPDSKISVLSADATLAVFARAAGCAEGRSTTPMPDRDTRDGTRDYLDKLNGCKVPVEILRVAGGGHSAPGHLAGVGADTTRGGPHNNDIESARLIWDFFRKLGG